MKYPDDYINKIICGDCLEVMKGIPDKAVDLVLTDPPYGINCIRKGRCGIGGNNAAVVKDYSKHDNTWDATKTTAEYFQEIFRISKNQIIFGANHFIESMPINASCWIVWDKENSGNFAECELAWTSFKRPVKKYKYRWNGMIQEDMKNKEGRLHPTMKPSELMARILRDFSEEKSLVLDCFLGSGSTIFACKKMNREFIGIERDLGYCEIAQRRLAQEYMFT